MKITNSFVLQMFLNNHEVNYMFLNVQYLKCSFTFSTRSPDKRFFLLFK